MSWVPNHSLLEHERIPSEAGHVERGLPRPSRRRARFDNSVDVHASEVT